MENSKEIKKTKKGGARKGAGRKPIEKRLSNYEKAVKLLDDNVESALQVLIDGLKDTDKNYRLRCSEILLKKAIPDRKQIESDSELELKIVVVED